MLLLKITLILFIVWVMESIIHKIVALHYWYASDAFPVRILSLLWVVIGLGFFGCLIATIILW